MKMSHSAKENIPLNLTSAGDTCNEMFCAHVSRLGTLGIHFRIRSYEKLMYLLYIPKELSHCATSLKVAGSIPDGFIEIFH